MPLISKVNELLGEGCEFLYWFGWSYYEDNDSGYNSNDTLKFDPIKENQEYELNGNGNLFAIYKGNTTYKASIKIVGITKDTKLTLTRTNDNQDFLPNEEGRFELLPGEYKVKADNCDEETFSVSDGG